VGRNADGRLEVFGTAADSTIWHTWQTAPNNGWSAWTRLGNPEGRGVLIDVQSNADGRLEAFLIGLGDTIWHLWQTAPNDGWVGDVPGLPSRHIDVNVILVSVEDFTVTDRTRVSEAIRIAREIYGQVDFGIRTVTWWQITRDQAGGLATIDSQSEAEQLTADWTVANDALDLFVVRVMNGADGWSAVNGSCDKDAKGMTGSVVSLNGNQANIGNTLAHEMGHYLGLQHVPDVGNFIGGNGASDGWIGIFNWQGDTMKGHCFVHG
jgi:hypothetical protein